MFNIILRCLSISLGRQAASTSIPTYSSLRPFSTSSLRPLSPSALQPPMLNLIAQHLDPKNGYGHGHGHGQSSMVAKSTLGKPEVLVVIVPWDPPQQFRETIATISPGVEVFAYRCSMYDTEPPVEIPDEIWCRATALCTWKTFPSREQAPNLDFIQLTTAGSNHLWHLPLFHETSINFCTANGVHPPQIAEWVIATFLGFQHHLFDHYDNQKQAQWVFPKTDEDTEDAVGLRMGILGYGAIGRQCARLAQAMGMDVHAFTLHEKSNRESRSDDTPVAEPGMGDPAGEIPSRWFHGREQLNAFLGGIDHLVVTLPLTDSTRYLVAREQFEALGKRKAFVTNASRGPVLDTNDLIVALNDGTIRGAALDVTDPEPLPADHPLWKARNVIITPHVSGNSTHYKDRVLEILAENLKRRASSQPVVNKVNRILGY